MSALQTKFEAAVANSKNLSERPDNATLLKIYALYKQASVGDNAEKKPGFTDMVGRAKLESCVITHTTARVAPIQLSEERVIEEIYLVFVIERSEFAFGLRRCQQYL